MGTEHRNHPHKILRVPAILAMDGERPVKVKTSNISVNGLAVGVLDSIKVGQQGEIAFVLYENNKAHEIRARVTVVHCVFCDHELKARLQFTAIPKPAAAAVIHFVQS